MHPIRSTIAKTFGQKQPLFPQKPLHAWLSSYLSHSRPVMRPHRVQMRPHSSQPCPTRPQCPVRAFPVRNGALCCMALCATWRFPGGAFRASPRPKWRIRRAFSNRPSAAEPRATGSPFISHDGSAPPSMDTTVDATTAGAIRTTTDATATMAAIAVAIQVRE